MHNVCQCVTQCLSVRDSNFDLVCATQILEYHVFAGDAYEESDFDDHDTLHMVEGESVKVC